MKATIKALIILLIIIHFAINVNAENNFSTTDSSKKNPLPTIAFSLDPLYTLQNGFRIDFEINIFKNQWILIGPQYFIAQDKRMIFLDNGNNTDMEGYGVDILHKIILKTERSITGPYAAYGVRYNSFNFKYKEGTFINPVTHEVTNTRYGFNVIFGYQTAVNNKLLIDFYTGCGLQVSKLSGDVDGSFESNSDFFMNYNYSGPRFLLGFRIGLFLN